MSMPSSSEEVATRQGSSPDLSSSSTSARSSWESEPWWARAISAGGSACGVAASWSACPRHARWPAPSAPESHGSQLVAALALDLIVVHLVEALGDSLGRAPVVDEDDRRVVLADQPQQLRVDRRPDRAGVGGGIERGLDRAGVDSLRGMLRFGCGVLPVSAPSRRLLPSGLGSTMSSTGTTISRSSCLRLRGVDDLAVAPGTRPGTGRSAPAGRCVAESPIRWIGLVVAPSGDRAAPASAPDASPASRGPRRGSRRRSPPRRR